MEKNILVLMEIQLLQLLRNNIKIVGRSFKYHRPRGIYTCGIEEPNALVQILSETMNLTQELLLKKFIAV